MAGITSMNNSLVIQQSEYKVGKYTDENSIYSWYSKDTFTNYKGMLALWNQRKMANTPLLNMTELQGNTIYVNGARGAFSYSIPYELDLPYIVENLVPDLARPGIDGQRFKIALSDNVYTNTERITYDFMNGQELFITEEEIYPEGSAWIYTVELVSHDKKNDYFDPEFLKAGTQFFKVSNSNDEYSTQKGAISTGMGSLKLQNQLSNHRSIYHWITGYANMLEVNDPNMSKLNSMYGNLEKNNSTMVMFNRDENGKPIKGSLSWMTMIEAMLWAEMKNMEDNDLMWSKGGTVSGSGRTPVQIGAGLYEQMKNGNRFKYTTLTKGMLDKIFGDLFYGSNIPIERRRVKVQVGTAASIELSKLFENEFGKTPFTINASDIGLLSGDRNNLSFQYRFTSMQFPTAGLVEFEINPAFDSIYGSRGMDRLSGEFPPSSHTIAIFDVTDSNSSSAAAEMTTPYTSDPELNSSSNLVLIKPKNRTGIDWGYEIGTEAPPGFSRQGLVSSSQRDGYAIWMKSFSSIWLKDATRSILLEKNLPR